MASPLPNFVGAIDLERIRQGDFLAISDAIGTLRDALNVEIVQRSQIVTGWKAIPFSAANFLAAGGTWTVAANQVADLKYLKFGTLVLLQFQLVRNTAGADGTTLAPAIGLDQLGIRIPELRAKASLKGADVTGASNAFVAVDNGGAKAGWAYVLPVWDALDEAGCVLHLELTEGTDYDATQPQGLEVFGIVLFEIEG